MIKVAVVVDLSGVADLRVLEGDVQRGFRIGAAVIARTLERDAKLRAALPSLSESGALVGSIQIRNLATLGGNICNAAPSADMAPPLLALDAEAVIAGAGGRRRVPMASFFKGVRQTVLGPDELLVEFAVPATGPKSGGAYLRHTPRRELDIAVVGVASQVSLADGVCTKVRIALAAVAPVPVRATAAEQALEGQPLTSQAIARADRKSTRLNSSHITISYAVFCLKKTKHNTTTLCARHRTTNSTLRGAGQKDSTTNVRTMTVTTMFSYCSPQT